MSYIPKGEELSLPLTYSCLLGRHVSTPTKTATRNMTMDDSLNNMGILFPR